MTKTDRNALIAFPAVILIGLGIAWAAARAEPRLWVSRSLPFRSGWSFAIQWLAFIPAYLLQNESFFDLTGSITYISVT